MNGIVISVRGDLTSIMNALNVSASTPKSGEAAYVAHMFGCKPGRKHDARDLLRNGERRKTFKEKAEAGHRKATALAMLGAIGRDVRDARAAFEGDHTPEAKERLGHMFDVVDQLENLMAED